MDMHVPWPSPRALAPQPPTPQPRMQLPEMGSKLEQTLYMQAVSKAEYLDKVSLKKRLQNVAATMQRKAPKQSSGSAAVGADRFAANSQDGGAAGKGAKTVGLAAAAAPGGGIGGGDAGVTDEGATDASEQGAQLPPSLHCVPSATQAAKMHADQHAEQKKRILKQQQHRLLLLRHASKCKYVMSRSSRFPSLQSCDSAMFELLAPASRRAPSFAH